MPPKTKRPNKKRPVKKKAKAKPTNVQQQQQTVNVFLGSKRKPNAKRKGASNQRGVSATQALFGGLIGQRNALLNNLDARNDARLSTLENLVLMKKVEDNSLGTEPAAQVGAGSNLIGSKMLPRRIKYSDEYGETSGGGGGGGRAAAEQKTPPRPKQTPLSRYLKTK